MKKKPSELIDRLVPISEFNKRQASKIFTRLEVDKSLVIVKNNLPVGVLLSVEKYRALINKLQKEEKGNVDS